MSGRRRRSEASWDPKEEKMPPIENHSWGNPEKWPNSEVTDDMAPGRQSWEEKRNDDISRDRHNDEWGNQYSHRPSGDTYGPPYRAHERRVGGNAHMSRDRDRIGSPNRSRTRSSERAQDVTRSRSRSRGRDYWESTRVQTRNPFYDHRQEYSNVRNWNYRDYTNDSRYDDYHGHHHHRDDRNQNKIQNQRRQSIRDTRIVACKFFAAGNCNRDDCRFSHDVIESGRYDERSHDNTRAHNLGNRNRAWNEQQSLDDMANSNFLGKNKPWDDGGDIHNHTSHDRKRARGDDLGFQDVGKSNHYKKRSWNDADERSRDDDVYDESSHDKKRTWDGDDVGFQDVGKSKSYLDNKKNSWNDEDEKRKKWDGELWGEVSQPQEVKNSGWGEVSQPQEVKNSGWGDLTRVKNSDLDLNVVSEDTNQKVVTSVDDVNSYPVSYHFNGPKLQLNGQIEESGKPLKNDGPQFYTTDLNVTNAIDYPKTLPNPEIVEKESVENKVTENENGKQEKENNNINHHHEKVEKEEEGDVSNDEKAMKLFKVALVEFVKDILKPKWKEGKMSREIHKNVVKKVVEKVTSTMHGLHIPTTQPKIDQYIGYSKSKITKLVEAYVGKLSKA